MFGRSKKRSVKDSEQLRRIAESQQALADAAVGTANVAQEVTMKLKQRLDDIVCQFESTARILSDALVIFDMDGILQVFNPSAEKMFGVARHDIVGKSALSLFSHDGRGVTSTAELIGALSDGHAISGVSRKRTFKIDVDTAVLDQSDGSSIVLMLIREPDTTTPAILEAAFDAIVISSKTDGRIMAANSMTTSLFGYAMEEIVGQTLSRLMGGMVWFESEMAGRNCFVGEGQHRDGRLMRLLFAVTPISWAGGEAILATIKDVTEVEVTLTEKRDNGIDMICCYGVDRKLTFANQTFSDFYGVSRLTLIGMDVRDLLLPSERPSYEASIAMLSLETPTVRGHCESIRNGVETHQDWIEHVTFDASGQPLEYQRVGRDIGEAVRRAIARRES